jgi:GH24 family phage-related lysozyme (muramidase)
MASFYSMLSRLQGEQKLQGDLNKSLLGIDVAQESQDINEARSQYRTDVEEAEREMARRARKRSKWGTLATIGSAALDFALPGVGKWASAAIAGVSSGLARDSVKPYSDTISTQLPGGKFHEQARLDLSADIQSTNDFISDAKEGQGLLNWTSALSDAYTTYQIGGAIEDFESSKDIATPDEISIEQLSTGLDSSQYIAGFEGFSADPYGDEGQVSIGYGTNTFNLGETVTADTTAISQEDALKELNFRIEEDFEPTIINKVGGEELYASIPGPAKTAMLDLAYNAGPNDVTDTLIENILKGNWEEAAKEYETLSLFGRKSKEKLPGLVERRKRGAMLLRGLIQEEGRRTFSDFFTRN